MKFREYFNADYKQITGDTWNGMHLKSIGSSWNSVAASMNDWEELPGIREVPYSQFTAPKNIFYAARDFERAERLAELINQNQEIEPLIIAIDDEGPYILEGAHRFVALARLGFNTFPAVIVIEKD